MKVCVLVASDAFCVREQMALYNYNVPEASFFFTCCVSGCARSGARDMLSRPSICALSLSGDARNAWEDPSIPVDMSLL